MYLALNFLVCADGTPYTPHTAQGIGFSSFYYICHVFVMKFLQLYHTPHCPVWQDGGIQKRVVDKKGMIW
jgi:hypothetical protein